MAGLPLPPPPLPSTAPEPIRVIFRKERTGTGPTCPPPPTRPLLPSLCSPAASVTRAPSPFVLSRWSSTPCIEPAAGTVGDRTRREPFAGCGWTFPSSSRGLSTATLLTGGVGSCAVTTAAAALSGTPPAACADGYGFRRRAVTSCADCALDVDESFDVLLWKASGRTAAVAAGVDSVATSCVPFVTSDSLCPLREPAPCVPPPSTLSPKITPPSTPVFGIDATFSKSGALAAFSVPGAGAALLIAF